MKEIISVSLCVTAVNQVIMYLRFDQISCLALIESVQRKVFGSTHVSGKYMGATTSVGCKQVKCEY